MIWTSCLVLSGAFIFALAHPAHGPGCATLNNTTDETSGISVRLNEAFGTAVHEKRVPGVAVIALNRDGSVIFQNEWGTIDVNDPSSAPITPSTKMSIASLTKAVTVAAALQLVEQGRLSVDDLVEDYLPVFGDLDVLEGFTDDEQPILRNPNTNATILQIMTHTSGQPHVFINSKIRQWEEWAQYVPQTPPLVPLAADPGTGWFYGSGTIWLGLVVEAISGQRLNDYFEAHIFKPLGIRDSGLITAEMYSHIRATNGTIVTTPPAPPGPDARPDGDGFLTSTLEEYSAFLLTLLNWGTHPQSGVTILKPSTVKDYIFTDQLPRAIPGYGTCDFVAEGDPVGYWNSNEPSASRSLEFLPGIRKGWSSSFLMNVEDVPYRRREGSGTWAGIFNLYYWIDPKAGRLGLIFTNLLPFLDEQVLDLFDMLEEEVYKA